MKSEVLTTTQYSLFKPMKGNRSVNEAHVNALVKSMDAKVGGKYLAIPIIVNGKHQVIDGQHRLAAIKQLGLPVHYVIGDDMDLKDVQKINSTSKVWNPADQAYSYATLGNDNYQIYLDFREEYGFDKKSCVAMLTGGSTELQSGANADFKNGNFKVRNLKYAKECADKIYEIAPFYKGFKRRSFVIAMLKLFQNKLYNHKQFLGKLEFNAQRMQDCANEEQYMHLIEGIYNWKNQEKVRFF